jgi:D-psicose/D-tagatose/L-ribulose 3-epimerase
MNPIGIISMQYNRPFTATDFPQLERWKSAGYDFVELLVPEPGELDIGRHDARWPCAGLRRARRAVISTAI